MEFTGCVDGPFHGEAIINSGCCMLLRADVTEHRNVMQPFTKFDAKLLTGR